MSISSMFAAPSKRAQQRLVEVNSSQSLSGARKSVRRRWWASHAPWKKSKSCGPLIADLR